MLVISHACMGHRIYICIFFQFKIYIYFGTGEDKINLFLKNFYFTFLWPYLNNAHGRLYGCRTSSGAGRVLYSIIKYLGRLESRVVWSGKMQQLNMVDWCIQERQTAGWLERMMRRVGIEGRASTKPVKVSADLKNLVLHKMLETLRAISSTRGGFDLTKCHGYWAQLWVNNHSVSNSSQSWLPKVVQRLQQHLGAPQRAFEISFHFQELDFVRRVFLWHLVTDLCLLDDQADTDTATASKDYKKLKSSIRELSNYVMYLLVKCKAMVTVYDIDSLNGTRQMLLKKFAIKNDDQEVDRRYILQNIRKYYDPDDVFGRASRISRELLEMGKEDDLWDLIAIVWVEMLCYIAFNCDSAFHTKQLCAGGEFVTHVKMLLMILNFSF